MGWPITWSAVCNNLELCIGHQSLGVPEQRCCVAWQPVAALQELALGDDGITTAIWPGSMCSLTSVLLSFQLQKVTQPQAERCSHSAHAYCRDCCGDIYKSRRRTVQDAKTIANITQGLTNSILALAKTQLPS